MINGEVIKKFKLDKLEAKRRKQLQNIQLMLAGRILNRL